MWLWCAIPHKEQPKQISATYGSCCVVQDSVIRKYQIPEYNYGIVVINIRLLLRLNLNKFYCKIKFLKYISTDYVN